MSPVSAARWREALAVVALLLATATPPGGAAAAAGGGGAHLTVRPGPVDAGTALTVTGDGFVLPTPKACKLEWDGPTEGRTRCSVENGMHAALTVGAVPDQDPTRYEVRVCVPSCGHPWAGMAVGRLTAVPPTPPDGVDSPEVETPSSELTATPGGEFATVAHVRAAVRGEVIAHPVTVVPPRAGSGQQVTVTADGIPDDTDPPTTASSSGTTPRPVRAPWTRPADSSAK